MWCDASLLLMRCISKRNKVGNTLLYSSPLSSYNPSYTAGRKRPYRNNFRTDGKYTKPWNIRGGKKKEERILSQRKT